MQFRNTIVLTLALVSCAYPNVTRLPGDGPVCSVTCIGESRAATAGHCLALPQPLVLLPTPARWCGATRTRAAVDGETVRVLGMAHGYPSDRTTTVASSSWLTWTILEGSAEPGESGGGVYGSDGALLAVVIETRDDLTYAWRLVP